MIVKRDLVSMAVSLACLVVGLSGCSTANQDSPFSLVDVSGSHPDGWIGNHRFFAVPAGIICMDCHGNDLLGGISRISCAAGSINGQTCHASGPAFHPLDWVNKTASGDTWHADAWHGNLLIRGLTCEDCHTPPGLSDPDGGKCLVCHFTMGGSRTPGGWPHGLSNHKDFAGSPEENVCVNCHEVNIGFGNQDACHNCHNIHPDPDWAQRALHGAAAKEPPGSMAGFETCSACHGEAFDGGASGVSCLNTSGCHQVGAPHPSSDRWKRESTPSHRSASRDNAPSCGLCHLGDPQPPVYNPLPHGANPGCFNGTLCHGDED
jgi:hypothetical protein